MARDLSRGCPGVGRVAFHGVGLSVSSRELTKKQMASVDPSGTLRWGLSVTNSAGCYCPDSFRRSLKCQE